MEKIYPPTNFDCSEAVNWREYFEKYDEYISSGAPHDSTLNSDSLRLKILAETSNLDMEMVDIRQLDKECSVDLLKIKGEAPRHSSSTKVPRLVAMQTKEYQQALDNCDLETIKVKKNWIGINNLGLRHKLYQENIVKEPSENPNNLFPGKDIVITVRIYRPYTCKLTSLKHSLEDSRYMDRVNCDYEMIVLGSQTLQDLKDKINCSHAKHVHAEAEDLSDLQRIRKENAEETYPSSFFMVGNTFFYDMRSPNSTDTTKEIRDWAQLNKIGNFDCCSMNDKCLADIKFRLGYPYIYQHVANCEHLIVFSDIRLLSKTDFLCSADYPYFLKFYGKHACKCCICHHYNASVLVTDSDRLPDCKGYFCERCFRSYNFVDKTKVGNFKMYPC